MFDRHTYQERRLKLRQKVGTGIILFIGNEESSINFKHNWYHFRQDSSFLYYFGLNTPGLAAIIDIDEDKEMIFGNELTIDDIVWTGSLPSIAELANQVGVAHTDTPSKLDSLLKVAQNNGRKIHFLPPYRPENVLKLKHWFGMSSEEIYQNKSVGLIRSIVSQRSVKTAEEVAEIDKAVNISTDMHMAVMKAARAGMVEAELVGILSQKAIASGGNLSFAPILTKHGQTLHTHYYGNTIENGDMILCDCGAETSMGYAGDMTRTFPVSGNFSKRQKELYQIVLDAHEFAVGELKPGALFKDIHLATCEKLAAGLKDVGLMKGDVAEAVEAGAHTMFFQCGLGHMMGLDVHDMEDLGEEYVGYTDTLKKSKAFGLKSLRLGKALEPGFVITVEPGIYIIPELIDKLKAENKFYEFINYDQLDDYRDFGGIRIEEDFHITRDGGRLLGNPVPKTIAEIESLRTKEIGHSEVV